MFFSQAIFRGQTRQFSSINFSISSKGNLGTTMVLSALFSGKSFNLQFFGISGDRFRSHSGRLINRACGVIISQNVFPTLSLHYSSFCLVDPTDAFDLIDPLDLTDAIEAIDMQMSFCPTSDAPRPSPAPP